MAKDIKEVYEMDSRELRELRNIRRELRRQRGINESTNLGNKLIATILIGGVVAIVLSAIILAILVF
ncbi:MAG: hypothetical protein RSG52_14160 [Terrisporobacter sp.]|uniref:hypothetical protein n=1 Tax=Terrisporobacter sp. TaxID=1965305 RepID=UPI002FC82884